MKFRSIKKPNPIYRKNSVSMNPKRGFYWRCECGDSGRNYDGTTRKNARDAYWRHRRKVHGGLGD